MSSPPALQQLRQLNRTSPDFHDQLCKVHDDEEYRQCVSNLQDDDLVWLVGYLDNVRRRVAGSRSLLTLSQACGSLDPRSAASRKCLSQLRSICGTKGMLPTSCMLSSDLFSIAPEPFASGDYGDVHQGTLNGSRVCTEDDPQKAVKVRTGAAASPTPSITGSADLLSRGRNMETFDPPEHFTPAGCHYRSLPIRNELDVWWTPAGLHQEEPRRKPTCTRRLLSNVVIPRLLPLLALRCRQGTQLPPFLRYHPWSSLVGIQQGAKKNAWMAVVRTK
jgi:hypothetical protein